MQNPSVSVIMNCLDCEKDLPAALESVKGQTFQDYEIIFIDNASTDSSPEIAKNFGAKLRYFRNNSTIPLGAARNQALSLATGKFIAFLDCDDLWKPAKLEKQLSLFRKNQKLGLACTDTEIFNNRKILSRVFESSRPARGLVFADLIERQWISMSSAMVKKEALDSVKGKDGQWFDERLNVCEEADLFYRIAHNWELDYVPEILTSWRVHSQNTTFQKFHQFSEETLLILDKHLQIYPNYAQDYGNLVSLLKKRAAFQSALALWKSGNSREARETIRIYKNEGKKYKLFHFATYLPGSFFNILSRIYFALPPSLRKY